MPPPVPPPPLEAGESLEGNDSADASSGPLPGSSGSEESSAATSTSVKSSVDTPVHADRFRSDLMNDHVPPARGVDEVVVATKVSGKNLRPADVMAACDRFRYGLLAFDIATVAFVVAHVAAIVADSFAIGWVGPFLDRETISTLSGKLDADMVFGGTFQNPTLEGDAALVNARLGLTELGLVYEGINARLTLADNEAQLRDLVVRGGGGTLTGGGTIELTDLTLGELDLDLKMERFLAIDNEQFRVTEWKFPPGTETGWHRHELDYVVVPMTTGELQLQTNDGESVNQLTAGQSYTRAAGSEHNVVNPGPGEFVFVEVELGGVPVLANVAGFKSRGDDPVNASLLQLRGEFR